MPDIHPFGRGTQRLETTLSARFPQARVLRVDRDSTRNKGSFARMLGDIHGGRADILVGTQILAKGHDFPNLTLVAVLNADSALYSADYRAPERLFAQLVQVAGRAGRAGLPGEVLIQTQYPRHPLYLALAQHDYPGFARTLLAEREQAGFPPYVFEAVLRAEAAELKAALAFLREATALAGPAPAGITLYDAGADERGAAGRARARAAAGAVHIAQGAADLPRRLERKVVRRPPARSALASGRGSDRVLTVPEATG